MNERELADLKVDYEEFEELRKRVETLEHKFNELLDWLPKTSVEREHLAFLKVKENELS